jgi:hypothetical protein
MAKGIRINFLSDVKDFLRGTKDVEKELEDVADSLDDVAKDGDKATEKLEKSFKDMAKEASKAGKDAQDGLGKGFKGAQREGETAATTIKDEFKSNLSEVTSSFDGSVESMGDLVQGTLGGLVTDLGPVGLAAGAAGAAGVGLLIAAITKAAEDAEAAKQRITDLGLSIIESGASAAQMEFITQNLKDIITDSEDATKSLGEIEGLIKRYPNLSSNVSELAMAYSGNTDAIESSVEALDEEIDRLRDTETLNKQQNDTLQRRIAELEGNRDALDEVAKSTDAAKQIEEDWLASGGAEIQARAAAISSIDAAYDEAVGSILDFKNEETGVLDIEAFVASIETRKAELAAYQEALATSGLTTEQKQALDDMGIEAASAYLDGIKSGTPEQARVLKESLTEAAKTSSGAAKGELDKAFSKPTEAEVKAELNAKAAQRDLNQFITNAERTPIKIRAQIVDREGRVVG